MSHLSLFTRVNIGVRFLLALLCVSILLIPLAHANEQQASVLYTQGMKLYGEKQYLQAFNAFQEIIRSHPNHKDALFMLGAMYEKGEGANKSDYEASEMYRRSWKAGSSEAYQKLEQLYGVVLAEKNQVTDDLDRSNKEPDTNAAAKEISPEPVITRVFMKLPPDVLARNNINAPESPATDSYEIIVTCNQCADLEDQAEDIAEKLGATISYKDSRAAGEDRIRSILEGNRTQMMSIQRRSLLPSRDAADDTVQLNLNLNCSGWCKVIQKVMEAIVAVLEVTTRSAGNEVLAATEYRALPDSAIKGKYYGLIIGINNYRHLQKLKNAVNDATVMDRVLRDRYGFETRLLIEEQATRDNIMRALNDLRKQLTENDSLIVFYSGHGEFNKSTDTSYWLPIDAGRDDNTKWLETRSIADQFKLISAKHILVIADSCFSGTMTRSIDTRLATNSTRENYLNKLFKKPSRVLIASGGNEPVTDAGGKGHSIFSDVLITALNNTHDPVFTAEELMTRHVKESVAGRTAQTPEYSVIRNSGHDGGDFIFRKIK